MCACASECVSRRWREMSPPPPPAPTTPPPSVPAPRRPGTSYRARVLEQPETAHTPGLILSFLPLFQIPRISAPLKRQNFKSVFASQLKEGLPSLPTPSLCLPRPFLLPPSLSLSPLSFPLSRSLTQARFQTDFPLIGRAIKSPSGPVSCANICFPMV